MKTASIFNTAKFEFAGEYIREHKNTDPSLDWDGVETWVELAALLEIDIDAMAGGKARKAIDNAAAQIAPVKPMPVSTEVATTITKADVENALTKADIIKQKADLAVKEIQEAQAKKEEISATLEAAEQKRKALLEKAKTNLNVKSALKATTEAPKAEVAPAPELDAVSQAFKVLVENLGGNAKVDPAMVADIAEAKVMEALSVFGAELTENSVAQIEALQTGFAGQIEEATKKIKRDFEDVLKANTVRTVSVSVNDLPAVNVGLTHNRFDMILKAANARVHCMLVGPAGSGKTHTCEQVAEALKLNFYAISVCVQSSKTDLLGYQNITDGGYVRTAFREAYEHGGVFVIDEIDNGNANVLSVLNSALANGKCAFPDGMIAKHADFVLIATANTYGTGANRTYVGRNQLDAATLDRLAIVDFPYDEVLEMEIAPDRKFTKFVQTVRAEFKNERVVISPRASIKGGRLLAAGMNIEDVIDLTLRNGLPDDMKIKIDVKAFK